MASDGGSQRVRESEVSSRQKMLEDASRMKGKEADRKDAEEIES